MRVGLSRPAKSGHELVVGRLCETAGFGQLIGKSGHSAPIAELPGLFGGDLEMRHGVLKLLGAMQLVPYRGVARNTVQLPQKTSDDPVILALQLPGQLFVQRLPDRRVSEFVAESERGSAHLLPRGRLPRPTVRRPGERCRGGRAA